jgi:transcriptional regulator with XRE-family HTH domain
VNATAVTIRRPPFHEALERLRVRRGFSYNELGDRAGVSKRDMIMFCKGEGIPTPRQFCRLRNVVFRELAPYREDLEVQWDRAGANSDEAGHGPDGEAMRAGSRLAFSARRAAVADLARFDQNVDALAEALLQTGWKP